MYFTTLGNIIFRNKIYNSQNIRSLVNTIKKNLSIKVLDNAVVGITGERNELLICVILACIESNITFIPIDSDIPKARVDYMIENSGAKYLIGNKKKLEEKYGNKVLCIDYMELVDNIVEQQKMPTKRIPKNPVYIMYTSGTTGRPKGVMISHYGFENFLHAIPQKIPFKKGENISCFTSISFDIVFLEIVLGLSRGMNLILADDNERTNPKSLIRLIKTYRVDILQMTPSMLNMIRVYNNESLDFLKDVKSILLGGEKLSESLLAAIHASTSCRVFNMYGPTETTIWSTIGELTEKEKCDIGEPILETNIYLVDDNNNLVDDGEPGELLIGGAGVAIGYINNPELTAEKFIELECVFNERVYRTGDICRFDTDHNLVYIERKDSQVKINGHRVELEEIEFWIKKQSEVKDAIVCEDDGVLKCFYISDKSINIDEIVKKISIFLPIYMIPAAFIKVDRFEYTLSNKIDKKKIVQVFNDKKRANVSSEIDRGDSAVADRVKKILLSKIDSPFTDIDCDTKLKSIGIDSISFVEFIVEIEMEFDFEFEEKYLSLEEFTTMKDLLNYIEKSVKS